MICPRLYSQKMIQPGLWQIKKHKETVYSSLASKGSMDWNDISFLKFFKMFNNS